MGTSARWAMALVLVPSKPFMANSACADSRMRLRVSSALCLCAPSQAALRWISSLVTKSQQGLLLLFPHPFVF